MDRVLHVAGLEGVDVPEPDRGLLRVPRPVRAAGRRQRADAKKTQWVLYAADGKYIAGRLRRQEVHARGAKQRSGTATSTRPRRSATRPTAAASRSAGARGITFPGMPFNQQMTVPVELTLRRHGDALHCTQTR